MYSAKRQFGNIGEDFVVKDLIEKGYQIIARNYLKKWGEIDIVVYKDTNLHFIEVKTVTWQSDKVGDRGFRPEENMTRDKLNKLHRAIQSFLGENTRQYHDTDWQIDLACVYLEGESQLKKIDWLENIII